MILNAKHTKDLIIANGKEIIISAGAGVGNHTCQ
jgi:hypothetical protein